MDELVSVIVPCYNSEDYIDRCIKSILGQTYRRFELIIINDGSTDNSLVKISEWKGKDARIRVISQKNLGQSIARNIGVEIAKGKYITFIDSDDFVSSDYLTHLVSGMSVGAEISMMRLTLVDENLKIISPKRSANTEEKMLSGKEAMRRVLSQNPDGEVCGKMFLKKLFINIEFPEKTIYEDFQVTLSILCDVSKVFFQSTIDYFYVQRKNSTMNSNFNKKKLDIITVGGFVERKVLGTYPSLKNQLMGRLFAAYTNVWMQINDAAFKNDADILWDKMMRCRVSISPINIDNFKVRMGIYLSLFGKKIFKLSYNLASRM